MFRCLGRPEEDTKSQGPIIVRNCEPPNMVTGMQTQVLYKSGESFLTAGSSSPAPGPCVFRLKGAADYSAQRMEINIYLEVLL